MGVLATIFFIMGLLTTGALTTGGLLATALLVVAVLTTAVLAATSCLAVLAAVLVVLALPFVGLLNSGSMYSPSADIRPWATSHSIAHRAANCLDAFFVVKMQSLGRG